METAYKDEGVIEILTGLVEKTRVTRLKFTDGAFSMIGTDVETTSFQASNREWEPIVSAFCNAVGWWPYSEKHQEETKARQHAEAECKKLQLKVNTLEDSREDMIRSRNEALWELDLAKEKIHRMEAAIIELSSLVSKGK